MKELNMRNQLLVIIATLCLAVLPQAHAAKANKSNKTTQPTKEKLVLMPLRVAEDDKKLQGAMQTALVEGLQKKYIVFSGEQVSQKAREIFMKESRNTAKKDCDETRCMQDIAQAFQAELIATANVSKQDGGYFLALSIQNIFDNKVEYSKTLTCKGCDAFAVVEKLKELSGASALAAPVAEPEAPIVSGNPTDPESALWGEVQKGNSTDDYGAYLAQYPKGKYVALAKSRMKKLQGQAAAELAQQEQSDWDTASSSASEAGYQDYLNTYPKGRYAPLATARITKLKKEAAAEETKQAALARTEAAQQAKLEREAAARQAALDKAEAARPKPVGPAMVRIPGKNYEMGKYEVTQKEWRDIMGNNPSHFSSCGDSCPVENVSWDDFQIYLQKLNQKTGRQYRLPTEAEWEYACYGGSQSEYCGGNDIDSVAWYNGNSNNTTHPVGQKQANGYGLYDMSGNVWEWMQDWYDSSQKYRALRGGSWNNGPQIVRAAIRGNNEPSIRSDINGFRLARTLP